MKPSQNSKSSSIEARSTIQNPGMSMDRGRVTAIALGAICLATFMTNFDSTVVEVALPRFQASLGIDMSGLQWILNAYNLPVVCLLLTSGTLGDIYGRKRVFLAGMLLFTIASIICGLSPNLEILLVGRTLQGIGAAILIPLSLTILAVMFPDPRERAKAIGLWSAVSALALVAGPALGGLLIDTLGWQSVFFLNIPLGVFAFRMIARSVEEGKNLTKPKLDLAGLVFSIILLASFTCLLMEGSKGIWLSTHIFWVLGITIFSLLAFWVIESRSHHPMIPLWLFKNSTFTIANIIPVLVFFASTSLLFIFGLFLQQVQGYSVTGTGIIFMPMNVAIIVASFVSGWIAARLGWRFPCISGLTLACVSVFSLAQTGLDTESRDVLWQLILSGFGGGLTIAPLASAAINAVPPIQEGIASAIFNISIYLGSILGISLQGTVFSLSLTSNLNRSLSAWNLPSNLQERLIADALHGGTKVPSDLPVGISASVWHQVFSQAFVSGVHAAVLIASVALLVGVLLILAFVPPSFKGRRETFGSRCHERPKE
jgi:EmrB/QacA subfamily drug resistance transporter